MTTTQPLNLYIGAYTQDFDRVRGNARGIMRCQLDPQAGNMRLLSETACDNPSYLALHPSGRFLFAVNEITQFGSPPDCAVSAYAIAPNGDLTLLNQQPSLGSAPCFLDVDPTGRFLACANYYGGNLVLYPIGEDGTLAQASANLVSKNAASHAHSLLFAPGGSYLAGCNLGLDQVLVFRFLPQGTLLPHSQVQLPAATGPRHLVFHPNGRRCYVVNETANSIMAFVWDASAGALSEIQTIRTLPVDAPEPSWAADVRIHPNGRFLYATNRGHDSLAIYGVDAVTGQLQLLGHQPTLGLWPRSFAIAPAGDLLLVANQNSNAVTVFRINPETGALVFLLSNPFPTPVYLKFA